MEAAPPDWLSVAADEKTAVEAQKGRPAEKAKEQKLAARLWLMRTRRQGFRGNGVGVPQVVLDLSATVAVAAERS
eukprot:665843-Pleurochrysis_carterae.AAC.1